MHAPNLIDTVLRRQRVTVVVATSPAEQTEVSVEFPDLRDAPRSVWGDWGPMYTVTVPPERAISIELRSSREAQTVSGPVDVERIRVESPMMAAQRRATPLVMSLPLPHFEGHLSVAYGPDGQVVSTQLVPKTRDGAEPRQRVSLVHHAHAS